MIRAARLESRSSGRLKGLLLDRGIRPLFYPWKDTNRDRRRSGCVRCFKGLQVASREQLELPSFTTFSLREALRRKEGPGRVFVCSITTKHEEDSQVGTEARGPREPTSTVRSVYCSDHVVIDQTTVHLHLAAHEGKVGIRAKRVMKGSTPQSSLLARPQCVISK